LWFRFAIGPVNVGILLDVADPRKIFHQKIFPFGYNSAVLVQYIEKDEGSDSQHHICGLFPISFLNSCYDSFDLFGFLLWHKLLVVVPIDHKSFIVTFYGNSDDIREN
jgi:hypothetical protein